MLAEARGGPRCTPGVFARRYSRAGEVRPRPTHRLDSCLERPRGPCWPRTREGRARQDRRARGLVTCGHSWRARVRHRSARGSGSRSTTPSTPRRSRLPRQHRYQPNAARVFEYQATAGTISTAAIAGLEAFANHHLARCCMSGGAATYDGQPRSLQELRDIYLDVRYGQVLPALLGRPDPRQTPWWQVFRRVQALAALARHGVTEPTTRTGLSADKKSLIQRLCDREYCGAARMMLDVFEHFSPGWLPSERRSQLPPPP